MKSLLPTTSDYLSALTGEPDALTEGRPYGQDSEGFGSPTPLDALQRLQSLVTKDEPDDALARLQTLYAGPSTQPPAARPIASQTPEAMTQSLRDAGLQITTSREWLEEAVSQKYPILRSFQKTAEAIPTWLEKPTTAFRGLVRGVGEIGLLVPEAGMMTYDYLAEKGVRLEPRLGRGLDVIGQAIGLDTPAGTASRAAGPAVRQFTEDLVRNTRSLLAPEAIKALDADPASTWKEKITSPDWLAFHGLSLTADLKVLGKTLLPKLGGKLLTSGIVAAWFGAKGVSDYSATAKELSQIMPAHDAQATARGIGAIQAMIGAAMAALPIGAQKAYPYIGRDLIRAATEVAKDATTTGARISMFSLINAAGNRLVEKYQGQDPAWEQFGPDFITSLAPLAVGIAPTHAGGRAGELLRQRQLSGLPQLAGKMAEMVKTPEGQRTLDAYTQTVNPTREDFARTFGKDLARAMRPNADTRTQIKSLLDPEKNTKYANQEQWSKYLAKKTELEKVLQEPIPEDATSAFRAEQSQRIETLADEAATIRGRHSADDTAFGNLQRSIEQGERGTPQENVATTALYKILQRTSAMAPAEPPPGPAAPPTPQPPPYTPTTEARAPMAEPTAASFMEVGERAEGPEPVRTYTGEEPSVIVKPPREAVDISKVPKAAELVSAKLIVHRVLDKLAATFANSQTAELVRNTLAIPNGTVEQANQLALTFQRYLQFDQYMQKRQSRLDRLTERLTDVYHRILRRQAQIRDQGETPKRQAQLARLTSTEDRLSKRIDTLRSSIENEGPTYPRILAEMAALRPPAVGDNITYKALIEGARGNRGPISHQDARVLQLLADLVVSTSDIRAASPEADTHARSLELTTSPTQFAFPAPEELYGDTTRRPKPLPDKPYSETEQRGPPPLQPRDPRFEMVGEKLELASKEPQGPAEIEASRVISEPAVPAGEVAPPTQLAPREEGMPVDITAEGRRIPLQDLGTGGIPIEEPPVTMTRQPDDTRYAKYTVTTPNEAPGAAQQPTITSAESPATPPEQRRPTKALDGDRQAPANAVSEEPTPPAFPPPPPQEPPGLISGEAGAATIPISVRKPLRRLGQKGAIVTLKTARDISRYIDQAREDWPAWFKRTFLKTKGLPLEAWEEYWKVENRKNKVAKEIDFALTDLQRALTKGGYTLPIESSVLQSLNDAFAGRRDLSSIPAGLHAPMNVMIDMVANLQRSAMAQGLLPEGDPLQLNKWGELGYRRTYKVHTDAAWRYKVGEAPKRAMDKWWVENFPHLSANQARQLTEEFLRSGAADPRRGGEAAGRTFATMPTVKAIEKRLQAPKNVADFYDALQVTTSQGDVAANFRSRIVEEMARGKRVKIGAPKTGAVDPEDVSAMMRVLTASQGPDVSTWLNDARNLAKSLKLPTVQAQLEEWRDLPAPLRKLLGENLSVDTSFRNTITWIADQVSARQLEDALYTMGKGRWMWDPTDPNIPPGTVPFLPGAKRTQFQTPGQRAKAAARRAALEAEYGPALRRDSPLRDVRVRPEFVEAFNALRNYQTIKDRSVPLTFLRSLAAGTKLSHTIGNLPSYTRNAISSIQLATAAGVSPVELAHQYAEALKVVSLNNKKLYRQRDATPTRRQELLRGIELGYLDPSIVTGDILDAVKILGLDHVDRMGGKPLVNFLRASPTTFADIWATTDNAIKHTMFKIFATEQAKVNPNYTREQVERIASGMVQEMYPGYRNQSTFVLGLRRNLFVTPFAFPWEIARIQAAIIRRGVGEMRSDNPYERYLGAKRLVGLTAMTTADWWMPQMWNMVTGQNSDDQWDLSQFVPPYYRNSSGFFHRSSNDDFSFDPLTYRNALSLPVRLTNAMIGYWDKGPTRVGTEVGKEAADEFFGTDIFWNTMMELYTGRTEGGHQLYTEADPLRTKLAVGGTELTKILLPQTATRFVPRLLEAPGATALSFATGGSARQYNVGDQLKRITRHSETLSRANTSLFTRYQGRDPSRLPDDATMQAEYQRSIDNGRRTFDDLSTTVHASIRLRGAAATRTDLINAGMSQRRITNLLAGTYQPPIPQEPEAVRFYLRYAPPDSEHAAQLTAAEPLAWARLIKSTVMQAAAGQKALKAGKTATYEDAQAKLVEDVRRLHAGGLTPNDIVTYLRLAYGTEIVPPKAKTANKNILAALNLFHQYAPKEPANVAQ